MSRVIGDPGVFEASYHAYVAYLMSNLLTVLINGERWSDRTPHPAVIASDTRRLLQLLAESYSTRPESLGELFDQDRELVRRYELWLQNLKLDQPLAGNDDRQTATELRDLLQGIHRAGGDQIYVDMVSDEDDDDE